MLLLALVFIAGHCAGRSGADDAALHSALSHDQAGSEVTFGGRVQADPTRVSGHEHLTVTTSLGDRLEVDHNLDLAPWVPAHAGSSVIVHGQLYIDPSSSGVHCTHARTSTGCPFPGWIELNGNYYE